MDHLDRTLKLKIITYEVLVWSVSVPLHAGERRRGSERAREGEPGVQAGGARTGVGEVVTRWKHFVPDDRLLALELGMRNSWG